MDDIEVKDGESGGGIMCTRASRGAKLEPYRSRVVKMPKIWLQV